MKKMTFAAVALASLSLAACDSQSPAADAVESNAANAAGVLENQADNLQMQADNAAAAAAAPLENQAASLEARADNITDAADAKADNMTDMTVNTTATNMTTNAM